MQSGVPKEQSVKALPTVVQKPNTGASELDLIGQGLKTQTGREMEQIQEHQESLEKIEGKRKEGRHYRAKKKVDESREKAEVLLCPLSG